MPDFFQRIERDLELIEDIVKYDTGMLRNKSSQRIREILQKLVDDVQATEQEKQEKTTWLARQRKTEEDW